MSSVDAQRITILTDLRVPISAFLSASLTKLRVRHGLIINSRLIHEA